jgi:hypothetical protein
VTVRGERPFQILSVDGQADGITVVLPTQAAQVHLLTLKCQPSNAGELRKQLLIRTDMAQSATVAVTIEATGVK